MKIVCEKCSAKYSIADEKVKGKVFKIRCKKCGESIIVRGDSQSEDLDVEPERGSNIGSPSEPETSEAGREGVEAQTKVFDYSKYREGEGEPEWHIVVDGSQQGPYHLDQIKEFISEGSINSESFVWKEGFENWMAIKDVPEFKSAPAMRPAEPTPEKPAQFEFGGGLFEERPQAGGGLFDQPESGGLFGDAAASPLDSAGGLFDSVSKEEEHVDIFSSAPEALPSTGGLFSVDAAQTADREGLFAPSPLDKENDIFGSISATAKSEDIFSSVAGPAAASSSPAGNIPIMTGQRNENSVLFSLSNLQALASGSASVSAVGASAGPSSAEASGLIDIRSLASSLAVEKESVQDDLFSIGGGFAPVLGAPILTAQPTGMSTKVKIIIGATAMAVIAIIAVVAFLVLSGKKEDEVAELKAKLAQIVTDQQKLQESEKFAAEQKRIEQEKKNEQINKQPGQTQETTVSTKGEDKAAGSPELKDSEGTPKTGSSKGGRSSSKKKGSSSSEEKEEPEETPVIKENKTSSGTNELDRLLSGGTSKKTSTITTPSKTGSDSDAKPNLDRADIIDGMNSVAGKVRSCGQGQSGTVTVSVVIGGTGRVISAVATGSFANTPIGNCVSTAVRSAVFPKCQKNTTVKYPFSL